MFMVSNTGPLIALAKIDELRLLPALFAQIVIPAMVQRELLAKTGPEADRLDQALNDFLQVMPLAEPPPAVQLATQALDPGERAAVMLAFQKQWPLLIDDRQGRQAAKRLGLTITGTAGLLVRAKKAGLIPSVRVALTTICAQGYWLAEGLITEAAHLAGES